MAFSPEVRSITYTTNAIESLHSQVRKAIRNNGHFPRDESAAKLIYLALRIIAAKWKRPPKKWHAAKVQLAIQFGDRYTIVPKEKYYDCSHTEFLTPPSPGLP